MSKTAPVTSLKNQIPVPTTRFYLQMCSFCFCWNASYNPGQKGWDTFKKMIFFISYLFINTIFANPFSSKQCCGLGFSISGLSASQIKQLCNGSLITFLAPFVMPSLVRIFMTRSVLSPSLRQRVEANCFVFIGSLGICLSILFLSSGEVAPITLSWAFIVNLFPVAALWTLWLNSST